MCFPCLCPPGLSWCERQESSMENLLLCVTHSTPCGVCVLCYPQFPVQEGRRKHWYPVCVWEDAHSTVSCICSHSAHSVVTGCTTEHKAEVPSWSSGPTSDFSVPWCWAEWLDSPHLFLWDLPRQFAQHSWEQPSILGNITLGEAFND